MKVDDLTDENVGQVFQFDCKHLDFEFQGVDGSGYLVGVGRDFDGQKVTLRLDPEATITRVTSSSKIIDTLAACCDSLDDLFGSPLWTDDHQQALEKGRLLLRDLC